MKNLSKISLITLSFCLSIGVAAAAVFPDVPDGHIFQEEVEALVGVSVISGNPDGNYYPDRSVNRAELLKMLYKAAGKTPDSSSVRCFTDVTPDSWYESYVCDASSNQYVNGYPDGSFKPGQAVNRVEALKMITNILDIIVEEIDQATRETVKFVDVSVSAWYTKYLFAAFSKRILPIAGMDGSRFYPESSLLRGEAAAYIFNALNAELVQDRQQNEESSSSQASSIASTGDTTSVGMGISSSAYSSEAVVNNERIDFPFDKSGKFDRKKPFSYEFTLDSSETIFVDASVNSGEVSCRLYLLRENGFSDEYYLGHQEDGGCYIHAALSPGEYQLQLQPTVADTVFSVSTINKSGDGNDGFKEASRLYKGTPQTAMLETDDIQDFYMLVVSSKENMTIDVSNSLEIKCTIFPMSNVDMYGFDFPECNKSYSYTPGTYYISISRSIGKKISKKSYTILLQR
ncbi:S-layer homology domain-containing protein [Candidatus Peregrinibacteria bacterium]|nr:S-layer homology domain-containing protein [Candidatus Peregrinibacteria bacterium]